MAVGRREIVSFAITTIHEKIFSAVSTSVCVCVCVCKDGSSFWDGNEISSFYGTSRFIYNLYETLPLDLPYFHKLKLIGLL